MIPRHWPALLFCFACWWYPLVNYRHGLLPSTEALLVMNACWCAGSKGPRRGWVLCEFRFVIATVGSFGLFGCCCTLSSFIHQSAAHTTSNGIAFPEDHRSMRLLVKRQRYPHCSGLRLHLQCRSQTIRQPSTNHKPTMHQAFTKHLPSIKQWAKDPPRIHRTIHPPWRLVALRWQGGSHSLHKEKAEEAHEATERLISSRAIAIG